MSDLKGKRESAKKMVATKSQWTKQKARVGEYVKAAEHETTVTKKLLKEFNAADVIRSSNKKETAQHQEKSVEVSEN